MSAATGWQKPLVQVLIDGQSDAPLQVFEHTIVWPKFLHTHELQFSFAVQA